MTTLVVSNNAPFAFIYQGLPLSAQQELVEGLLEIVVIDLRLAATRSHQCCLVYQVCEVSS